MGRINERFICNTTPVCKQEAVVKGEFYRFTILTDRLIRMEYSENGIFEDRATQTVINRDFEVPDYKVIHKEGSIIIRTNGVEISYHGGKFTKNSLSAKFYGMNSGVGYEWHFGSSDNNLKGTARTLDDKNGETELDDGIMSRVAMSVLDDSKSLILSEDGWVDIRKKGNVDIYLFAYRDDYKGALKDFCRLTGNTPLIPRYALGNWWSRFHKYSQEEYCDLVKRFESEDIPFSVAVIDMDWHYTDIEAKYGSGWTGFTWNKDLFPNHIEFLDFLKKHGMKATLNLHPAEGIAAHESSYKSIGLTMGVDVENEETVAFDIANPKFVENYFDLVLHPMEEEGVSFWWMDWQQGNTTKIEGLDPLWMLNHFHYADKLNKNIRPMIFSRYSGPGSHRYPIGFSGDAHATWESLDFQPYFTANAANISYGWWSHDIGGHMKGVRDDEMVTRWIQFGVFSPIMRLHSDCNDFQSKEPWHYNKLSAEIMGDFLRLRHKLIPYIYTMNYRAYKESEPIVSPVYYEYNTDEAYSVNRNEYLFGTEMLVTPITSKADNITVMGNVNTYLPEGIWFDFFSGRKYMGNRRYKLYRNESEIPVMVKAGGIIPMNGDSCKNITENPSHLEIQVFPGADNSFTLYEDDGETMAYANDIFSMTKFDLKFGKKMIFTINKPNGDDGIIMNNRKYTVVFRTLEDTNNIRVAENGLEKLFKKVYKNNSIYIEIENVNGDVVIEADAEICKNDNEKDVFNILLSAQCSTELKLTILNMYRKASSAVEFFGELTTLKIDKNIYDALTEVVVRG